MKDEKCVFDHEASLELKGVAILMLLFHHLFFAPNCYEGYSISFFPFAERQVNDLAEALRICVPIFAFISGYGLFIDYKKQYGSGAVTTWCVHRYIKTFSGYWFVWLLTAVIFQLINGSTLNILLINGEYNGFAYSLIDFLGLVRLFDTPTLCNTWWYMSAAFVFIILTPIIYRFRRNQIFVLMSFIVLPRVIFGKSGESFYLGSVAIYTHIVSFVLGSIFANYSLFDWWIGLGRQAIMIKAYKIIAELWLIVIGYRFFHSIPRNKFWEYHFGFYPMLIILFAVEFILIIPCIKKMLYFLGKNSMNMFLSHSLLQLYYSEYLYSQKHFAVVTLTFLGSSLLLSMTIGLLRKITKYNEFCSWMDSIIVQKVKTIN